MKIVDYKTKVRQLDALRAEMYDTRNDIFQLRTLLISQGQAFLNLQEKVNQLTLENQELKTNYTTLNDKLTNAIEIHNSNVDSLKLILYTITTSLSR